MSALARFSSFSAQARSEGGILGAMGSNPASLRRLARGRGLRVLLRTGLMALAAAGLAVGGLEAAAGLLAARNPPGRALATAATPSHWSEIRRPIALYDLAGTEFAKLPAAYRARRREPDGAREDVMTFGRMGDAGPFLQLSLLRAGDPAEAVADGSVDGLADGLARLAGTRGLSATRVRAGAPVDTRLGRFEAADLLLWADGAATPCLGFRGARDGGGVLQVSGFACGAPGRPMGRAALACALDRVDLVSAGDDHALRAAFVAAERRGGSGCFVAGTPASLLATDRHLGWLDPDGALPPLRGLFEATLRPR